MSASSETQLAQRQILLTVGEDFNKRFLKTAKMEIGS